MGLKSSLGNAHGAKMQEATVLMIVCGCLKKIKKNFKFYFIFKLKYQVLCVNSNYQKARDPALPCTTTELLYSTYNVVQTSS